MKQIIITLLVAMCAGGFASCTHHVTEPKPTCDTCKTPCDTCHTPCDTCQSPSDTTSHNFTWSEFTNVQGQNNMTGCWVFGPNDIIAVNDRVYRFDGTGWNWWKLVTETGGYEYIGGTLFGFTPKDFWIIYNSIIAHCDGNVVHEIDLSTTGVWHYPSDGVIHAAWGTSSKDMFFVGDSGTILHYDGSKWTKFPKVTGKSLHAISGTGDNNIWADGFNPITAESVLLHYDGGSWSEVNVRSIGNIGTGADAMGSVWVCDSSTQSIVYTGGSHVWHKSGNLSWVSDSGKITNSVGGGQFLGVFNIQGNSANDIMVAADGGFISHWNGRSWNRYDTAFNPGDIQLVTNGLSFNNNTACVVGKKDGTSWVLIGQRK